MPSLKTLRHQEAMIARLYEELTQIRIDDPDRILEVAQERRRKHNLTTHGKLAILAADHPARRVVRVGNEPLAMADRLDLLTRIVRILSADAVDGIMSTMDILEDLLLLHDLLRSNAGPAFLNNKVMIASLNRGGLSGASWEMDDPLTGPSPDFCKKMKFDGVKLLLRICDSDPNSIKTMTYCSDVITQCSKLKMPVFLEPLPVVQTDQGYKVEREAEALAKIVGVASALGESSRYLWLKLPYCKDFELVAQATSLPILVLGGEVTGSSKAFLAEIKDALACGHNVRGTMVGRNVLYPTDEDAVSLAEHVSETVHGRQDHADSVEPSPEQG